MKDIDETQAPLIDHLVELRMRLVRCVIILAIGFGIGLFFAKEIYGYLVIPLQEGFPEGEGKLIYTQLYGAFFIELKVALFGGFCLSFPIIAAQLWAFVAPGLYAREKKPFLLFICATPFLFASGAALAYFVVMPVAFRWFIGFEGVTGGLELEALPEAEAYLSLVMRFILAFGISFLLPILLLILNRAGLVSRAQLAGARRYVVVGVVILAAVVTPPDPGSQLILAVPLLLLFEGSLLIMRFGEKKKADESDKTDPQAVEMNSENESKSTADTKIDPMGQ